MTQPGVKGRFLLFMGVLMLLLAQAYGAASLTPGARQSIAFAVDPVPLSVYTGAFYAVAALCAVGAVWLRAQLVAFAALQAALVLWGLAYVGSWLFDDAPRAWLLGSVFLVLSGAVLTVAALQERRP